MDETLEQFVESVNGTAHLRVEQDFGGGFVRLHTSEAERRQAAQDIRSSEDIVLELLRNARDAHAAHIFLAVGREGDMRTIVAVDDGCGIPLAMHELVFEPRVTSKLDTSHMDAWGLHGRGMALFSIAENAEEARVACSGEGVGSSIIVRTNLGKLGERKDQSTFPAFLLDENGTVNVRGPKNIVRTVCEFAIESRAACSVYIGSPAEVVATMYAYGTSSLSVIDRLFPTMDSSVQIVKRVAQEGDPAGLAELAGSLGLGISQRTARRILDGELEPVASVLERIAIQRPGESARKRNARATGGALRSVKLQREDASELSDAAKEAFARVAQRYYLEPNVEATVNVRQGRLTISIPLVDRE